ncbi:MAG: serine/threonine protein kinase [Chloroflexota bacterium]|nr:serine/threonine protein kinase [Chloroflexota bacterium]
MTYRIGQQLGNYHLLQLLGRGGFAEVYLGRHIHLDTLAAVKVLHTHLSRDDSEQFHTEARTIAHLTHPHIVRIMDYGIDIGTPFLVMDYAPNGTLHQQHPRGTRLQPTLVAHYVIQIAAALQYAHEHGIIHRDVKPENTQPSPVPAHVLGTRLFTFSGHSDIVSSLSWSQDGRRIASGSFDTTVQVWDAITGNNLLVYQGHANKVTTVAYSYDGVHLASGGIDATVQVWDPATGAHLLNYRGHKQEVRTVQWTPDGTFIASGGQDGVVHVWNSSTGELALAYKGHTASINQLSWSPDGKYVASASDDGTIHAWNAFTGTRLLMYRGHSSSVLAVAWSPDNNSIASGGTDMTVQVW